MISEDSHGNFIFKTGSLDSPGYSSFYQSQKSIKTQQFSPLHNGACMEKQLLPIRLIKRETSDAWQNKEDSTGAVLLNKSEHNKKII
jgi:hypothetical protein